MARSPDHPITRWPDYRMTRLLTLFRSRPGQCLQFGLIDFDFAGFFQALAEGFEIQAESLILLLLHQAVANLVFFGYEILLGGSLALLHAEHGAIVSAVDWTADFSRFQREGNRRWSRHRADIWNLAIRQN